MVKNSKYYIIIFAIILFVNNNFCFAQMQNDMIKYWYYRNRLQYFVVPGDKIGESQIICVRNKIYIDPPENDPNDPERKNADYGQHGKHNGLYIGVLATEYYLLKENGQNEDAEKTLEELNFALDAVQNNWDWDAENFWGELDSYNGFFIRGNVPCDFYSTTAWNGKTSTGQKHIDLLNKGLDINDTWEDTLPFQFGDLPRGHPGYVDHRTTSDCGGTDTCSCIPIHNYKPPHNNIHPESMSEDEAIGILLGCSLAAKLADSATQVMAKTMCDKILTYILNLNQENGIMPFTIYEPDGSVVGFDGGFFPNIHKAMDQGASTWAYGPGFFETGYQITGEIKYRTWPILWTLLENAIGLPAQQIAWQAALLGAGEFDELTAILLVMGNYTSARIKSITDSDKKRWDTFYIALWEVLNNKKRNENHQEQWYDSTIVQLNSGPCEGPYNYGGGYYPTGGWASTYRWFKSTSDQNGGEWYTGNYHGLDYMLLYNLTHIITKDTAPYYVNYIDKNLIGTVTSPMNFVGISTITSSQTINQTSPTVNYVAGDSIHLTTGFHAVAGSNFHAFISDIDCSSEYYPDNVYTNYYDSLISVQKSSYELNENDDTVLTNNITLPCPNDTIQLYGVFCDTCTYHWDFGNGQTSTLQDPKVYYNIPGDYPITVIMTDTNGVKDTILINVVAPDCKLYGYLTENPSCGGAPVVGDSLIIKHNNVPVATISPAGTQVNGYFLFNSSQVLQLDTSWLYTIVSKSGIPIIGGSPAKKISQWIAQSPLTLYYNTSVNQEWAARYNDAQSLNDGANAIDLSGNVYVTGYTDSSATNYDMLTIKYNPAGTQQWKAVYRGNVYHYNDLATAITVDDTGKVYITGVSYYSDAPQITTIAYTKSGIQQWVKRDQNPPNATGTGTNITLDHAGDIIVGGATRRISDAGTIMTILKYHPNGTVVWDTNYTGTATIPVDTLKSIVVDDSNNVYISGLSKGADSYFDMLTRKFSSSGLPKWVSRYDSSNSRNYYAYSNAINKNGNIIVAGYSHKSSGNDEIVIVNYNRGGAINWKKVYNSDAHDFAGKVLCNSKNEIYIAGYSGTASSSGLLALKYDSTGTLKWSKHSLSDSVFVFKSAALDIADNLYITGTTKTNGYTNIKTQKFSSNGDSLWTVTYNGPASNNDVPAQIIVSDNGNAYVCGKSIGINTNYDFVTIKYSQCESTESLLKTENNNGNTDISQDNSPNISSVVNENVSIKVIPNPNNGNMRIAYEMPENTNGTFEVYNLVGNKLFSYPLFAGTNSFTINRTDLNQGIYIYRAYSGNKQIAADKIVIIK